jgi:hypothetical protein
VPSQFPPIGLFDTVATAADLTAVLELAGWTNDRLVEHRLARLPQSEWVFGRPNSSIAMAAFLHVAPGGMRFNGSDLGAWYASSDLNGAIAEVAHHLRREAFATAKHTATRTYRTYTARLVGSYTDLRGQAADFPELYDPTSYVESQKFGESLRADGADGLLFDSLRYPSAHNVVGYRPSKVLDITQADHLQIGVTTRASRIDVTRLAA